MIGQVDRPKDEQTSLCSDPGYLLSFNSTLIASSLILHIFSAVGGPAAKYNFVFKVFNINNNIFHHVFQAEVLSSQSDALQQMAVKLNSLHYPTPTNRRHCSLLARNNRYECNTTIHFTIHKTIHSTIEQHEIK